MPTALVLFESFCVENFSLSTAAYACGFLFWFTIRLFAVEFSSSRQYPNLRHLCTARSFIRSVAINPASQNFLRACSVFNPLSSRRVDQKTFVNLLIPFAAIFRRSHIVCTSLCSIEGGDVTSFQCHASHKIHVPGFSLISCPVFIHWVQHQVPH